MNEETTTTPEDDGVQSETVSELDRADQIAERLKRENDRKEGLLSREEALAARAAVGGRAEAGITPVKVEETAEEYAAKFDSGNIDILAK